MVMLWNAYDPDDHCVRTGCGKPILSFDFATSPAIEGRAHFVAAPDVQH